MQNILALEKSDTSIWKKILLARMVVMVWVIFFLNFVAGKLFLYSLVWWFDMPMHFFGGAFLAFLAIWIFLRLGMSKKSKEIKLLVFWVFIFVLIVGILWEIFEVGTNIFITFEKVNIWDTISDLFFDLSGGAIGFIYALHKISKILENKIIKV